MTTQKLENVPNRVPKVQMCGVDQINGYQEIFCYDYFLKVACSAGTASVIIALTDGELNEWQFDTAQREVRCGARGGVSCMTRLK